MQTRKAAMERERIPRGRENTLKRLTPHARFTAVFNLSVLLIVGSTFVLSCTKMQTESSPQGPANSDPPSPSATGTPESGTSKEPETSIFYPVSKKDSLVVNDPGKINLYIDQHDFNPTAPQGTFFGLRNKSILSCGKASVGEKTEQFTLKIYNDMPEAFTLEKPTLLDNMNIEFDASQVFPMKIESKTEVNLKIRLSAATQGIRKSEMTISKPDNVGITLSLDIK